MQPCLLSAAYRNLMILAFLLGSCLFSPDLFAAKYQNYTVMKGDVNSDGNSADLYFSSKKIFLLIGGKIPMYVDGPPQYALYFDPVTKKYGAPVPLVLTDAQISSLGLTTASPNSDYFVVPDLDGNGRADLLVQGTADPLDSVVLMAAYNQIPTVATIPANGVLTLASGAVTVVDYNADGREDLYVERFGNYSSGNYSIAYADATGRFFNLHTISLPPPGLASEPTEVVSGLAVGSTPYRAEITPMGNASISVPLETPPGVNDLQPKLTLTYSSGGGGRENSTGLPADTLGYGWQLTGVDSIYTCKTGTHNKAWSGTYAIGPTDRLCLNGEPTIRVSGAQFQTGTVYHTRKENYIQITQKHNGTHPWFEVKYPDGRIAEFGKTTDSYVASRVLTEDYTLSRWSVNKITDAFGNAINYTYQSGMSSSHYPLSITYDNTHINFYYTTRSDFTGDVPLVLLHTVKAFVNDTLVRDYRLLNETGSRRRLRKIQQCGYTESGALEACLSPLTFNWMDAATPTIEFDTGVERITDGLGATTRFTYQLLSAPGSTFTERPFGEEIQHLGSEDTSPYYAVTMTNDKHVATGLHRSNGMGGEHNIQYAYEGAAYNSLYHWGFVGFWAQRTIDEASGIVTYRQAYLDKPLFYGEFAAIHHYNGIFDSGPGVHLLSKVENQFTEVKIPQPNGFETDYGYKSRTTELFYEAGTLLGAKETATTLSFANAMIQSKTVTTRTAAGVTTPPHEPSGTDIWTDWATHTLDDIQSTETTTTTYTNRTSGSQWLVGFVSSISKSYYNGEIGGDGVSQVDQLTTFVPHASSLKVDGYTHFPGDPQLELTTSYTYDTNGNTTSTTISGANVTSRTTSTSDFLNKRYPQTLTNAKGHVSTIEYDLRFGSAKQITDPNYLTRSEVRDAFGRVISTTNTNDVTKTYAFEQCFPGGCGSINGVEPVYRIGTNSPITPQRFEYADSMGRVIRTEVVALTGGTVREDILYDNHGRVDKRSLPYFAANSPQYIDFSYDLQNRITGEARPDGGSTSTTYTANATLDGIVVEVVDTVKKAAGTLAETQSKRNEYNLLGLLTKTTDAYGSANATSVSYAYNPLGLMKSATVDGTATSAFGYDAAGNRTTMTGPNVGTITTNYTALGQIDTQVDNKDQLTSFDYDLLGRTIIRTDEDGTATWLWDTATNGIGLLHSRSNSGFTETYSYNGNSQLTGIDTDITVPGYTESYNTHYLYDSYGRLSVTDYPSGFSIKREYNSRGYLTTLRNDSTNAVLQTFDETDSFGQIKEESYGNTVSTTRTFDPKSGRLTGIDTDKSSTVVQDLYYTWRSNGTLESRTHYATAVNSNTVSETMIYDSLNRLKTASTTLSGTFERDLDYQYNALGNLRSKTSTQTGDTDVTGYEYGTTANAGPHAVSEATVADSDGAGTVDYTLYYDLNGAVEHYDANTGPDKFIEYNAANQPTLIVVGASLNDPDPEAKDEFRYDPDGARVYKKSRYEENGVIKTSHTFYVGGYENIFIENDPDVIETRKTQVGDAILHIETVDPTFFMEAHLEYLHRDHLGSVDTVTDESGNVLQVTPFEPFGSRKDSDWQRNIDPIERDQLLEELNIHISRGFTGHEHLDRTGFIHMNGRLYDPTLGRFLSADPIVQDPTNSQSWNRYSYVFNSPLSYTDPSGYQCVQTSGPGGAIGTLCPQGGGISQFEFDSFFGASSWFLEGIAMPWMIEDEQILWESEMAIQEAAQGANSHSDVVRRDVGQDGISAEDRAKGVTEVVGVVAQEGYTQISVGISGTLQVGIPHLAFLGAGGGGGTSIGLSIPDDLFDFGNYQAFVQFQANGYVGIGLFAGVGLTGSVTRSDNPISSGSTSGIITEGNLGWGVAGGASFTAEGSVLNASDWMNPINSLGGTLNPKAGVGFGLSAGVGQYTSTVITTPTW